MEIKIDLKVPASFLYDKIIDSVIFDIRRSTGETLIRKNLENFEYIKTFSKNSLLKF